MLFFATTINYLDRQVLSLLQPLLEEQFHWTDNDYGTITAVFSLFYAISLLFAGRFVDRVGTKKGYAWAIAIWSFGAALHALCGIVTEHYVGLPDASALRMAQGADIVSQITMVSITAFVICRCVLALGEAGNFPAAIKATAEYFPKKDRAFATGIFNSGANVGAILAPLTVPVMAEVWGWETAFLVVGAIGFVWLGFWQFIYKSPENNPRMNAAERAYIEQDQVWEAGTEVDVCGFAQLHHFRYFKASDEVELAGVLPEFFNETEWPVILEVETPRLKNAEVLKSYFRSLQGE